MYATISYGTTTSTSLRKIVCTLLLSLAPNLRVLFIFVMLSSSHMKKCSRKTNQKDHKAHVLGELNYGCRHCRYNSQI